MALGIVLGAFGAHILKEHLSAYHLEIFKTGVLYHLLHGLALFVVAWLITQTTDQKVIWVGVCFILGIALFSGSLYGLALTQWKWLGPLTPLGGLSFIMGWVLLLILK